MQGKSSNSAGVRVHRIEPRKVLRLAKEHARRLVEEGKADAVILYGSFARGDYTPLSDLDLLIVSDDVPENPVERLKDYMVSDLPLDVEPRVYTRRELYRLAAQKRRIIREILTFGLVLAGDKKIIREIEKIYSS